MSKLDERSFVTGYGARDSHSILLRDGSRRPTAEAGLPYDTITDAKIEALILNPTTVAKETSQWFIPSISNSCDARNFGWQKDNGRYGYLAADIDKGNPTLATLVEATRAAVGPGVKFWVYSSRSATTEMQRWRILVPTLQLFPGSQYTTAQEAFFALLTDSGLTCDSSLRGTAQLVYLPNRGPDFYEYHLEPGEPLNFNGHPITSEARKIIKAKEAEAVKAKKKAGGGWISYYNLQFDTAELLAHYGYVQDPNNSEQWASPMEQAGSSKHATFCAPTARGLAPATATVQRGLVAQLATDETAMLLTCFATTSMATTSTKHSPHGCVFSMALRRLATASQPAALWTSSFARTATDTTVGKSAPELAAFQTSFLH